MHAFNAAVDNVRAGADAAEIAAGLYEQLTDDERLGLLDGDTPFWPGLVEMTGRYNGTPIVHGEVARLGIPGTRFVDGPRGCVAGNATAFPVSMARGATWDVGLEEQVGRAIGAEVRAVGGHVLRAEVVLKHHRCRAERLDRGTRCSPLLGHVGDETGDEHTAPGRPGA